MTSLVATDLFADSPFPKVNWGSLVVERQEKTVDDSFEPLSVGQMGVTPQLESVARPKDPTGRKIVRKGDIVINSRSDRRGASGVSSLEGAVSVVYSVMAPRTDLLDPGFAGHLLKSSIFQDTFYLAGVGIVDDLWTTNFNRMSSIRVPLPPLETQRAIADYLDRETAEVDAMSADLDEMEALLTERRRQSVSPNLSDYPSVPFWSLFHRVSRRGYSDEKLLSVYRERGVIEREGWEENRNRVGSNLDDYQLVEPGDLAINKMKAWQGSLGVSSLRGIVSPAYFIYKPHHHENADYLNLVLRSSQMVAFYETSSKGIRPDQWDLQPERLEAMPVPLPPQDIQREVVERSLRETDEIDAMLADITELRDLLAERRAAVIAAAVTGQIDVPTTQEATNG